MTPLFAAAYFPPVAYLAAMARGGSALVEAKESYPKQTYRNRMEIMTAGGVRALTVPVVWHNHCTTDEVLVSYHNNWPTTHLRTLKAAYASSPYYEYYADELADIICHRYDRLIDLCMRSTEWLLQKIKACCTLELTTDWVEPRAEQDYRATFSPKTPYPTAQMRPYYQTFGDRHPFAPNLSAIDLICNMGPEAKDYL